MNQESRKAGKGQSRGAEGAERRRKAPEPGRIGWHLLCSYEGMAQNFRLNAAVVLALVIALTVGVIAAANAHRRSTEKARLVAEIQRLDLPAAGYAMESAPSGRASEDTAWRAYCERERVALIADARAALAH